MKLTRVNQLRSQVGQEVRIKGWVNTIRDQKTMQFLIVRDETGLIQIANSRKENPGLAEIISGLTNESVIEVVGQVMANEAVQLGGLEIIPKQITVLSLADPNLPVDKDSSLSIRLDWRFIDLRRPENHLIFQIQTTAEHAMREYWYQNGFIEIHSPKLMGSASESGAELFSLKYFDTTAYLAQSPQFYKQMAMAAGFNRVFEIGPVFRANPSFTSRHDTEFTSIDVEISWIDSHEEVMAFEEQWLQYVLKAIREKHGAAIKETFGVDVVVPELPFPRMSMEEAYQLLDEKGHELPEAKGDLDPEGERLVARHIMEKYGHEFVFVTDYPVAVRPFYHMRHEDRPHLTKSYDLLWKGLEITTGAQREHRYDILARQAQEKGLSLEGIDFYLNFFKYGCPPHGGFGFGLTRMLMVLLNVANVREVTYLYRGPNRLTP
ncbi:MAG TPA: aspartate--tRNA(Asn) ligase [Bacillota bacterium]|nr:aspartate--tRNA(Asn) ligase [Bacillota bacterium]